MENPELTLHEYLRRKLDTAGVREPLESTHEGELVAILSEQLRNAGKNPDERLTFEEFETIAAEEVGDFLRDLDEEEEIQG